MLIRSILFVVFLIASAATEPGRAQGTGPDPAASPERYDVIWDSPSKDCMGSMPLGNGDIGLNAWVEESGDLVFYVSKTDAWDEYGRLVKVACIRVALDPKPPAPLEAFRQQLSLKDGTILVRYGKEENPFARMRVWVDANNPVIVIEVEGEAEAVVASIEPWRTTREELPSIEVSDVLYDPSKKDDPRHAPTWIEPDVFFDDLDSAIGVYHRNAYSVGPALCAEIQGLTEFERPDPLLHRAFGVLVAAQHGEVVDAAHLRSRAAGDAPRHLIQVHVFTRQPAEPGELKKFLERSRTHLDRTPFARRRGDHEQWWRAFWERSWIHVTATGNASEEEDDAFVVSRAYALQRFLNACAGRGAYPIKFNGSIFTVPHPGKPGGPDYRRWGPGYWWQNTRLPYLGMCASGDFDLMRPLFRMYAEELMPLFLYRTQRYLGHGGLFVPECIYFWGDLFSETYGWTPFAERDDKLQESRWHKWEWVSGPELAYYMLDFCEYRDDDAYLQEVAIPFAQAVLTFFDEQYKTDGTGKLLMQPAQALETWWDCTDPMPEIAGLQAVTERLLELKDEVTTPALRAFWKAFREKIPDLPVREVDGRRMLAPAERFAHKSNVENPELYAVFPFRRIAVGRPDLDLGLAALEARTDKGNAGWRQDDLFMAYLGLADQARDYLVGRARNKNPESRFPGFFGPNYDWVPDQDHGGVLVKTLQSMVLQADGRRMLLLPAWPADWDVDFKLRAPSSTTVRGVVQGGKIVRLEVSPKARQEEIVLPASSQEAGGKDRKPE